MPARVAAALLAVLLAGCGTPAALDKQAEEVGSIAAEGALLAHDASEGETTEVFTRVHARELAKNVRTLRPAIRDGRLERVARSVGADLERLADEPADERGAAELERRLEAAARRAEEIGKAAA